MRRAPAFACLAAAAMGLASCSARAPEGYRPPQAADPLAAFQANWAALKHISGDFNLTFRYSDGRKAKLTANIVAERGPRSRVDLNSERGLEAMVIVGADVINLVNPQDRYYMREDNTPENSDRMIGLYLPPEAVTAVLCGAGFNPDDYSQVYPREAEGGGLYVSAFHEEHGIRAEASIDAFGRLRSIRFFAASDESPLVYVNYLDFKRERRLGLVWPARIEIELQRHGEHISLRADEVDFNSEQIDLDFVLTPRATRGGHLRLDEVPPGAPVLYRSVKDYVRR